MLNHRQLPKHQNQYFRHNLLKGNILSKKYVKFFHQYFKGETFSKICYNPLECKHKLLDNFNSCNKNTTKTQYGKNIHFKNERF